MNQNKQKDFQNKKDWITQMAEFFGWSYWCEDINTGHLQYRKTNMILNVWTTKMTVMLQVQKWSKTFYQRTMDSVERIFENPDKVFQVPKNTHHQMFIKGNKRFAS